MSGAAAAPHACVFNRAAGQSLLILFLSLSFTSSAAEMQMRRVWAEAPDNSGNPSADGRLLSFVDWETGDVALHDLISGKNRRLTHKGSWSDSPEYAEWPKISPDGKRVVYSWVSENYGHTMYVVDTEAAGRASPRAVLQNPDLHYIIPWAWSQDGKSVIAMLSRGDDTNQLVWVSLADGAVRVLKSLGWHWPVNVNLSSDGRFIVYDLNQAQNSTDRDIYVMAADGTQESALVEHPSDDYAPIWTPDGHSVVFASNRTGSVGLWSIPVREGQAAGSPELIKSEMGQISPLGITRDGALFYADHRGMDDIFAAELDPVTGKVQGTPVQMIVHYIGRNSAPVWSPDGKFLAYFSNRDPARAYGVGTCEIVVRSVENGSERVFSGARLSLRPAVRWTPDGQSLLIAAKETDSRQRAVFTLLDLATGKLRTITRASLTLPFPVMLPDGSAFLAAGGDQSNGLGTITAYSLTTGEPREIYRALPGWVLRNLALAPDGGQMAFDVADSRLQRNVIYTLPAAGGKPREVVRMEEGIAREGLAWTPDGRYLLFAQTKGPEGNELFRVPAGGGVPHSTGLSARGLSLISPHPDGRHIAYTVGQYFRVDIWALKHFLPASK